MTDEITTTITTALIAGSVTALVGFVYDSWFAACSPEEQQFWEDGRIMHHGALGLGLAFLGLIVPGAALKGAVAGAGIGLMLTDLNDVKEWNDITLFPGTVVTRGY